MARACHALREVSTAFRGSQKCLACVNVCKGASVDAKDMCMPCSVHQPLARSHLVCARMWSVVRGIWDVEVEDLVFTSSAQPNEVPMELLPPGGACRRVLERPDEWSWMRWAWLMEAIVCLRVANQHE